MLDPRFVYLAAVVDLIGGGFYAFATLKGHTKPNRVTWFLWAVIPLITLSAQLSEGVGLTVIFTLAISVGPLLVFISSFVNRQAYWKINKFDWACGGLAILALILWALTRNALAAIILSVGADFIAGLPTLIKSYRYPETESASAYLAGIFSGGLTLLTIKIWNPATYLLPFYLFVWCALTYALIHYPKLRLPRKVVSL